MGVAAPGFCRDVIYFMRCANSQNIKIGFTSRDAALRIKEFGLPRPELLTTCPGDQRLERALFHRFRRWRVSPTSEWFLPGPELLQHIRALQDGHEAGALSDAVENLWARADEVFQAMETGLWEF